MDDNDILKRAQTLIFEQKYQQARSLLEVLEGNTEAVRWIAKIDEIAAREASGAIAAKPLLSSDQSPITTEKPKRSPIRRAARELVLLVVGFFGVFVINSIDGDLYRQVLTFLNIDTVYEDSRIHVEHPANWEALPVTEHSWCEEASESDFCLYFIRRDAKNYQGIVFLHVELDDEYSSREFAEFNWGGEYTENEVYTRRNRRLEDVTVGGFQGVAQSFLQLERDDNAGMFYISDIYVADGLDGYVFHVVATSQCEMAGIIGEVNEILSSVQLSGRSGGESPKLLTVESCD
jgi:hypothetical protein